MHLNARRHLPRDSLTLFGFLFSGPDSGCTVGAIFCKVCNLRAVFTSFISLSIFVSAIVMQGLVQDYKEAEKMPSELATIFYGLTAAVKIEEQWAEVILNLNRLGVHSESLKRCVPWASPYHGLAPYQANHKGDSELRNLRLDSIFCNTEYLGF